MNNKFAEINAYNLKMKTARHHEAMLIAKYTEQDRPQLLQVWESSVLATHHFLTPADFEEIKVLVGSIDFTQLNVYCLHLENNLVGFIGVLDKKIEMLFLHPDVHGQGLGGRLLRFALSDLSADKVDVNEQNTSAVHFYRRFGFEPYERTEVDDQGKPYPLLRMKLDTAKASSFVG